MSVQAKDIPVDRFLAAVVACSFPNQMGANESDVAEYLGVPDKVARAKARGLIKRGAIYGCACGCRGDWRMEP